MTESSGVPMQLRRMFTVYVLTLALCLLFVSSRTSDEKPPQDVEWFGGPADVIVPEGADAPRPSRPKGWPRPAVGLRTGGGFASVGSWLDGYP